MTLKQQLISYLYKHGDWIQKAELLNLKWYYINSPKMYMSETVGRKLREAEEESLIAVKDDPSSNSVIYKYIPKEMRRYYIPKSKRINDPQDRLFTI